MRCAHRNHGPCESCKAEPRSPERLHRDLGYHSKRNTYFFRDQPTFPTDDFTLRQLDIIENHGTTIDRAIYCQGEKLLLADYISRHVRPDEIIHGWKPPSIDELKKIHDEDFGNFLAQMKRIEQCAEGFHDCSKLSIDEINALPNSERDQRDIDEGVISPAFYTTTGQRCVQRRNFRAGSARGVARERISISPDIDEELRKSMTVKLLPLAIEQQKTQKSTTSSSSTRKPPSPLRKRHVSRRIRTIATAST